MKRHLGWIVLVTGSALLGCSKPDATAGRGSGPASSSRPADGRTAGRGSGPASSSRPADGRRQATSLTAKAAEERLVKGGWTIESNEPGDQDWVSRFLKIQKGQDDAFRSAKVWIDALGEAAAPGAPRPHITAGTSTLLRLGWAPGADKKPPPDLASFAKDLAGICTPDKATDELFNNPKFDQAVTKWGLREQSSRSGGRLSPSGVVYNHRFLDGDAGTLAIEIVFFAKAIEKGDARLVGTTLIAVEADDDATRKALFDLMTTL